MAPPIRTQGSVGNSSRTAAAGLPVTIPAAAQVGDTMVIILETDGTSSAPGAPNANWVALTGSPITSAGGSNHSAFRHEVLTGEPGTSVTFTLSATDFCNAEYAVYSGTPVGSSPLSGTPHVQSFNGVATLANTGMTTLDADTTIVVMENEQAIGDANTHTGPGSERVDIDGGSLYDFTQAAAGATGTQTVSWTGATAGAGWVLALKASGVAPVAPAMHPRRMPQGV